MCPISVPCRIAASGVLVGVALQLWTAALDRIDMEDRKVTPPLLFANFSIYHLFLVSQNVPDRCDIETSKIAPKLRCFVHWHFNLLSQRRAFFDNWTSKIGRGMRCFVHFDLKICFAPERRAIFRHLNCRKWPGAGILTCKCASCNSDVPFLGRPTSKSGPSPSVFLAFWLIALGAKAACKFLDILTSKRLKPMCFLHILACKCASCNSGVQFFISPLKTWVSKRSFSEPTFRPSRSHEQLEKHGESRPS